MDYLAAMRALVRSVELGSFSKAAAESGAKVSTVSRYISALEADLGAALLNRSTRRLALTEAGHAFYERAVSIVLDVEDARRVTSALNSKPRGTLRINLPGAFGRLRVMPEMPAFLSINTDVKLEVAFSDARVDLIETRTDLAVRIGSLPDSSLKARRLALHHRLLCVSPNFAADLSAVRHPEKLANLMCLAMMPNERWHFRLSAGSAEPLVARPSQSVTVSGRLCSSDLQAVRTAALGGVGIALLPSWLVGSDIAAGTLVGLLTDWEFSVSQEFDQAIWALYPPKKIVSPKVRVFMDFLEARLSDLPSTCASTEFTFRHSRAAIKKANSGTSTAG